MDESTPTEADAAPKPKMYFVSGFLTRSLMEMDLRDFSTKKVADFPWRQTDVRLLYHSNKVFAVCTETEPIGSYRKRKLDQVVLHLDVRKKIWVEAPSMNEPRFYSGLTLFGDSIYAFGGWRKGRPSDLVERFGVPFSIRNGLWIDSGKAMCPRAWHAVGVMEGKIYLVGGVTSLPGAKSWTSSMHAFDPENKTWSCKASMPSSNFGLSVAVLNSRLYAIGGVQNGNSCKVYFPEKNEWEPVASLNQPRLFASAFVLDGSIYVVGGNKKGQPTMEKYDASNDSWTVVDNCHLPSDGYYQSVAFTST
jgi:hypothetical protein